MLASSERNAAERPMEISIVRGVSKGLRVPLLLQAVMQDSFIN